jgi:zinc protease
MFEIHQDEIDGVPAFWADTPPGPFVGGLVFRTGRADEPMPWSGITHIVEHLALAPLGQQAYDHNGMVDASRTVFHVVGEPGDTVDFLGRLTASLADLPMDRLLMERRILSRESEQHGPSIDGALRWFRFGSRGHGSIGEPELGLRWLGPEAVSRWARERFNRANAALMLSGPPPAGLSLSLPDGERHAPVALDSPDDRRFPTHLRWDGPGVAISMLLPRRSESTTMLSIAHRRAREALRFQKGLVYDVAADYEPLNGDVAHVIFGAECQDADIPAVRDIFLSTLDELAADGPTPDELAVEASGFRRQFTDRDAQIGFLDAAIVDHLFGVVHPSPAELLARRLAIEPGTAAATLRDGLTTMLLLAAGDPVPGDRFAPYPDWSTETLAGREFGPPGFHLRRPKERLLLSTDGVTVVNGPGEVITVRYDRCVLVDHEGTSRRVLLGEDGHRVIVDAEHWRDGQAAVDAIDAAVPPELVACDEHGIGALSDPDSPNSTAAQARSSA